MPVFFTYRQKVEKKKGSVSPGEKKRGIFSFGKKKDDEAGFKGQLDDESEHELFIKIDSDHNGYITRSELTTYCAKNNLDKSIVEVSDFEDISNCAKWLYVVHMGKSR